MKLALAGLLLACVLPVRAAMLSGVPRIGSAPLPVMAGALPALAAPAPFAAPSLMAAPAAAPALTAPITAALAPAASPSAAPAAAALPAAALAATPSAAPQSGTDRPSNERAALDASLLFDGAGLAKPSGDAPAESPAGWTQGTFESADGLTVAFKRRAGPAGKIPRVYFGGLALNESFDPLFSRPGKPARSEFFAWTRGHPPTGWKPTASVIDADARDLARLIVLASRETGSPKVEVALHSFAAGVFQRMTQMRGEPEVRAALKLLSGSRVVLMNGMTHYDHVETLGGPAVERMASGTRMLVDWLDSWDGLAERMKANLDNPFLAVQAQLWLAGYRYQRDQLLSAAAQPAVEAMRRDLAAPWDKDVDGVRRGFQKSLDENARDPGWQEALLRRSRDSFALDFKTKDAQFLRRIGVRIEFVHSLHDQLLNWQAAQLLFGRFGIRTPAEAPPAGTVLTDPSGLFRATVVDADHYYPLKKSGDLARRLDP